MGSCLLYYWLVGALVFTDKCTDGISYNNKQFSSIKNVKKNKKKNRVSDFRSGLNRVLGLNRVGSRTEF